MKSTSKQYLNQVSEYAQKLLSSAGEQDGLRWETVADDGQSRLVH